MNSNNALISVCIATYNSEEWIITALESISNQDYDDLQIIISDDASVDTTVELCKNYAKNDSRIEIYPNQQRLGWIGNTNRALNYSRGSFFSILPHDDQMMPGYLSKCLKAISVNPAAVGAFSDVCLREVNGTSKHIAYDELEGLSTPVRRAVSIVQHKGCWAMCYHGLFRRSVLKSTGGLSHHRGGEFSADLIWILKIALIGEIVRVPEVLFKKVLHTNNLSRIWDRSFKNRAALILACTRTIWSSDLRKLEALPAYYAIICYIARIIVKRSRQKYWKFLSMLRKWFVPDD